MRGINKAVAAAGVDQKTFAKEIGMDRSLLNKMARGHVNPTPDDFKKICDRAGLPPQAVATVQDVDYGVIPITGSPKRRKGDRHNKKATVRFRVLPIQRKQLQKDIEALGFATIQSWGDHCIKQLRADAERGREK